MCNDPLPFEMMCEEESLRFRFLLKKLIVFLFIAV